ncbi:something about silencing protein 10-like [Tachypleus tridentatus]|uniref:something about silencing protein 10-like n=1 Tax=Tachypleus tridentatus TaxID=6853 RepID=UPI003FD21057
MPGKNRFKPSEKRNKNTRKEATKESVLGSDDEDLYTNFRTPNPKSDDYYFNEVDEFHAAKDKILLGEDDTTGLEEDGLDQEEVMGLELSEDDDEDSELDDYYTVKKDQIISDNEDGDLPDVKAWGKRKSMYYSADYVDEDYGGVQAKEEELIAAEEREVLAIQRRLAEEIDEEELELEWFLPQKNEEGKDEKVVEEKITRDLSKLSKREKLELLKQESPELLDLVEEFKLQMNELNDKIQPIVQLIKSGVIPPGPASEFLITKQNLILNYCTNISFYMVLKAQRVSVRNHPVMKRLLAYRNLLKKLEPVDKKLSPEINEILEKLNKGEHIEPKLSSNLKKPPKQKLRILQQKEDSVEPKAVEKEEQDKRKACLL